MTDIGNVKVVDHPLVQHKLSLMRKKETPTQMFRSLLGEVSRLLCYEVTRNLELRKVSIETPLAPMQAPMLSAEQLVLVSVLRAGNGLLDGMLDLVPTAKVAHIGLYRDPKTLEPVEYYYKVPEKLNDSCVIIVDPMLATGNSAVAAANKLKESGASELHFLCLLAAQEGVDRFSSAHPNVPITTAAIDDRLNSKGYIVPGLGDAGDRMYGTS